MIRPPKVEEAQLSLNPRGRTVTEFLKMKALRKREPFRLHAPSSESHTRFTERGLPHGASGLARSPQGIIPWNETEMLNFPLYPRQRRLTFCLAGWLVGATRLFPPRSAEHRLQPVSGEPLRRPPRSGDLHLRQPLHVLVSPGGHEPLPASLAGRPDDRRRHGHR